MELRIIDISTMLAALVLPVWIIWRLPRYYISILIGVLMFWGWMVVGGELILYLDPYYDSIAPLIFYYYGWLMGLVYCLFWAGVREVISKWRKSGNVSRTAEFPPDKKILHHHVLGIAAWGAISILCVCCPLLGRIVYNETSWPILKLYIFACGPILLLSLTMASISLWELIKQRHKLVSREAHLAARQSLVNSI